MFNMMPYRNRSLRNRNETNDTPMLWNPFADDFFRSFFGDGFSSSFRVDIEDEGDHYMLHADLPGIQRENLNVNVEDGVMTISAAIREENEDKKKNYVYHERRYGTMSRSFNVEGVEEDKITGEFKDGVLHMKLPKASPAERPTSRRININ